MTIVLFALLLAATAPSTHLSIQPWTGSDFQITSGAAAKYRLEVTGRPNASIRLRAVGVAQGWIAAFCTPRICSPQQVTTQLSRSGDAVFQFELIRESAAAPTQSSATIAGDDGATVSVPAAHRQ